MSERNAFIEKFKANLDSWNAEIDKLEAKAREAKADTSLRYQDKVNDLRAKRDRARYKLEQVEEAGADAWEELKAGAQDAWRDLKGALDDARSTASS